MSTTKLNELIEQATADATIYADFLWYRGNGVWRSFYQERFAELIIRDVVNTVKRTQETSPDFEWAILNNYGLELKDD